MAQSLPAALSAGALRATADLATSQPAQPSSRFAELCTFELHSCDAGNCNPAQKTGA